MKLSERRAHFRKGLHELFLPKYDKLCELLPEQWQPFYGVRTFEEQQFLYNIGRITPGRIVTNARPGSSPHNYGMASDWTYWTGETAPLWPPYGDKKWDEFRAAVDKADLRWGGYFNLRDCCHVELRLDGTWHLVREVYFSRGLPAAIEYIRKKLL